MKKATVFLLSVCLAALLVGCGGQEKTAGAGRDTGRHGYERGSCTRNDFGGGDRFRRGERHTDPAGRGDENGHGFLCGSHKACGGENSCAGKWSECAV